MVKFEKKRISIWESLSIFTSQSNYLSCCRNLLEHKEDIVVCANFDCVLGNLNNLCIVPSRKRFDRAWKCPILLWQRKVVKRRKILLNQRNPNWLLNQNIILKSKHQNQLLNKENEDFQYRTNGYLIEIEASCIQGLQWFMKL
jgi:hypothetical protein